MRPKINPRVILTLVLVLSLSVFASTTAMAAPCACDTWDAFENGSGTETDPWLIETPEQLNHMRAHMEAHYKLANDIDLTEFLEYDRAGNSNNNISGLGWEPIGTYVWGEFPTGAFRGSLDGNGKTISGLWMSKPDRSAVGLFGCTAVGIVIKDLTLNLGRAGVSGGNYNSNVGGLVGNNSALLTNCHITGTVIGSGDSYGVGGLAGNNFGALITDCSAECSVSAEGLTSGAAVGGLIGYNESARIVNCNAAGIVNGSGYATRAGGLIGYNYGWITDCYATTDVSGNGKGAWIGGLIGLSTNASRITGSYATGTVSGEGVDSAVGGLIGYNAADSVTNCYAAGAVTGTVDLFSTGLNDATYIGGLVGQDETISVAAVALLSPTATPPAQSRAAADTPMSADSSVK